MDTNVNKYRALLASVRLKSFSRAAEELGHTPSAVSRMVRDLERDWGVALVEKTPDGIVAARDTRELLRTAGDIVAGFDLLQRQLCSTVSMECGTVSIAAPSSVVSCGLPGTTARFLRDHPRVNLSLSVGTYAQVADRLREGQVDMAFLPSSVPLAGSVSVPVAKDELVVVAPSGHHFAQRERISADLLVDEPFIADDETAPLLLERLSHVRMRFTAPDLAGLLAMVEHGLGVSLVPSLILGRGHYDVTVRPLEHPVYRTLCLVYRDTKALTVASRAFIAHVEKDTRDHPW